MKLIDFSARAAEIKLRKERTKAAKGWKVRVEHTDKGKVRMSVLNDGEIEIAFDLDVATARMVNQDFSKASMYAEKVCDALSGEPYVVRLIRKRGLFEKSEAVAKDYDMTLAMLAGTGKTEKLIAARKALWVVLSKHGAFSFREIGEYWSVSPTTVSRCVKIASAARTTIR